MRRSGLDLRAEYKMRSTGKGTWALSITLSKGYKRCWEVLEVIISTEDI